MRGGAWLESRGGGGICVVCREDISKPCSSICRISCICSDSDEGGGGGGEVVE